MKKFTSVRLPHLENTRIARLRIELEKKSGKKNLNFAKAASHQKSVDRDDPGSNGSCIQDGWKRGIKLHSFILESQLFQTSAFYEERSEREREREFLVSESCCFLHPHPY